MSGEEIRDDDREYIPSNQEIVSNFKQSVIRVKKSVDRTWSSLIPNGFSPFSPDIIFSDDVDEDGEILESRRYTSLSNPDDHMVYFRAGIPLADNIRNLAEFECEKATEEDVTDFVVRKSLFREYIYLLFEEFGQNSSRHESDRRGDEAISLYLEPLQDQLLNPEGIIEVAKEHDEYMHTIGEVNDTSLGFAPMLEVLGTSMRAGERNQVIELSLQRLTAGLAYASINFEGSTDNLFDALNGEINWEESPIIHDLKQAFRARLMGSHKNLIAEYYHLTATQRKLSAAVSIIAKSVELGEGFPEPDKKHLPHPYHASKFPSILFANSYPLDYRMIKKMFRSNS